ncbi:MAG: FprA family A-type flavoprotein [Candidatus Bathyarchaeota archaeon]|nr:FprA family A-type flavoprotein [Candidatus Bathyarchaeota archaeon]
MSTQALNEIVPSVFWVGASDWHRRMFDSLISLPYGTSYNAYLVVGKNKIALIDTVWTPFADLLLSKIGKIVKTEKIDYLVMNHAEPDHSGSIPEVLSVAKNAKLVAMKRGIGMAKVYYDVPDERMLEVKEGDTIDLGGKTLRFIEAPWLHWPETIFTYLVEDSILFPCDFFGSHIAVSCLFDDEVDDLLLPEAKRYYADIMMPFPVFVKKALDKIKDLDIKMIAPSHGVVYRNPKRILDAYEMWARGPLKHKVVILYVSMWGSTEALEKTIEEAIAEEGIETVPYNLVVSDLSHLSRDLVDASAIIIGSPTYINGAHPIALTATEFIRGQKPRTKLVAIFGSYGWGGGAASQIEDRLKQSGFQIIETLECRGPPKEADLERARKLGKLIAQKIKQETSA